MVSLLAVMGPVVVVMKRVVRQAMSHQVSAPRFLVYKKKKNKKKNCGLAAQTVPNYYSMAKRPLPWTPNFACMAGINDMCCDASSGLACPNNFKCNHDAMRCDVKEPRLG
jgi:hypothetical protein